MKPETHLKILEIIAKITPTIWRIIHWACLVGSATCTAALILYYTTNISFELEYLETKFGRMGPTWFFVFGITLGALHLISGWAIKCIKEADNE